MCVRGGVERHRLMQRNFALMRCRVRFAPSVRLQAEVERKFKCVDGLHVSMCMDGASILLHWACV